MIKKVKKVEKILYLPVETVVRDLDANLLLGYEALKQGFNVVIGEMEEVRQFAKKRKSGVYLFKHWERTFPFKHSDPERENFIYIGFHPEGLVYVADDLIKKMNVPGETEKLDAKFVYGREQKELLVAVNPKLVNIIKEVGHPRFDLLRPQLQFLFMDSVSRIQQKHGKYVLINTNFTSGNPSVFYEKSYIQRKNEDKLKKWGTPLTSEEEDFIQRRVKHTYEMMKRYREMAVKLAERFPSITVILRPHPSENHGSYLDICERVPNLEVIHEGNVFNWILGAEAVIQTGCTTAIESWAAGKSVLRFNPVENSDQFESPLPNLFGVHVSSEDELFDNVSELLNGKPIHYFEKQLQYAKPHIESIDGDLSVRRIMNFIDSKFAEFLVPARTETAFLKEYYRFDSTGKRKRYTGKKALRRLKSVNWLMTLRHGSQKASEKKSRFQKFPGIEKKYLSQLIKKLDSADNIDGSDFQITPLDMDTYLIANRHQ